LHRAGADFVMSHATMSANVIFNILERNDVVMVAEGLNIFDTDIPDKIEGKSLIESSIRPKTGCSVLAIKHNGEQKINPDPKTILQEDSQLVLIDSAEAERKFVQVLMNGEARLRIERFEINAFHTNDLLLKKPYI